jgi:hypothetical protein
MPTINYGFIGLPFTLLVLTFLWVMLSTGLEMSADKKQLKLQRNQSASYL